MDLISYEVSQTNSLAVKEVTEGTGGRCGSAMLNKRFRRFLKQTHGEKYWTNERLVLAIADFEAVSDCYTSTWLRETLDETMLIRNISTRKTSRQKATPSRFQSTNVWD